VTWRTRAVGVRLHLAIATTALAVVCVVLTGQLMHRTVDDELETFTRKVAAMSAKHVAAEASANYRRAGGWSSTDVAQQVRMERVLHHDITILDRFERPVPGSPGRVPPAASAAPIRLGGDVIGTAFVAHEDGGMSFVHDGRRIKLESALSNHLETPLLEAVLLAAVLAGIGGVLLALHLARPLTRLTEGAERLARGELDSELHAGGCRETRALALTLDRLGAALRRQDESRRATAADVSHELRNAMVGIVGRIEAIQDGMVADGPRALEAVKADGRRAGRLIDDIQRLTDAQRPALLIRKEPLDLGGLVEERVGGFAPRFTDAGILLEWHISPTVVLADAGRMAQVVDNLLSNALRYTDAGGRVVVRARRSDDTAVLEVSDTGVGIAPDDLERVFDRFVRLKDARERAAEGTGVGLAIVQELAINHGGRVDVSSVPGVGSTFRVTLPAAPAATAAVVLEPGDGDEALPGEPAVWRLRGDIDTASAGAVRTDLLRALPQDRPHVVLDLTEVGFMDSAGLHVLFAVQREVHARGGVLAIVVGDVPQVRRLLDIVAPRETLPVVETRDAALRHLHARMPVAAG
jgi:two-component system sensor histidine kinase BaeS